MKTYLFKMFVLTGFKVYSELFSPNSYVKIILFLYLIRVNFELVLY